MWHTVNAIFEQFEAGEPIVRARLAAGGLNGGRVLRLDYELKGAPSSEVAYFHGDAERDLGVWSLLRPRALLAGSTVVARDGERLR